jgi:hypothetical protein
MILMRRVVLSVLCGIALFAGTRSEAQESTRAPALETENGPQVKAGRTSAITIAPFSLLGGVIGGEYETAVARNTSVFVGPQFAMGYGALSMFGISHVGAGAHGGLRWFITDDPAPEGFWIGPEFDAGYDSYSASASNGFDSATVSYSAFTFDARAVLGYTVIARNGFDASFGLGAGFGASTGRAVAGASSAETGLFTYFSPSLRINMGYAF